MMLLTQEYKFLFVGALFWLTVALACNIPTGVEVESDFSQDALRQTLRAQQTLMSPSRTLDPDETPFLSSSPFVGLQTATPGSPSFPATQSRPEGSEPDFFIYRARPGDTLSALAYRFGVSPEEIKSPESIPDKTFLTPGQILSIPNRLGKSLYANALLPDSEIIYSPSTVDFQIEEYIDNSGGYLSTYGEMVDGDWSSAAEIVQRVAADHAINPRLLLTFLEYRSQWVLGQPANPNDIDHPIGFEVPGYRGLYYELDFTATQLNIGYYGWRLGTLTELQFHDGSRARLSPQLNPGSVALQHLFSKLYDQNPWFEALYGQNDFLSLYHQMFGDPWARAAKVEPLFTNDLAQPALELPFLPGERWSFTGGPHMSWNTGTTRGGLDFAPVTGEPACVVSRAWVTASASGVIVRSDNNVVVIDLDGDGYESTGWVLMYLHVAEANRVPLGTEVNLDDRLGHPSCERGKSTGTHVHIARKYNGEWIEADGPLPFVLSGWEIEMGPKIYQGSLVKGGQEVAANPLGPGTSIIVR